MSNQNVTINDVNFTVKSSSELLGKNDINVQDSNSSFLTKFHQYDELMTAYLSDANHLTAFINNPREQFNKVCSPDSAFLDELTAFIKKNNVSTDITSESIVKNVLEGERSNGWDLVSVLAAKDVNTIINKALPQPITIEDKCTVSMGFLGNINAEYSLDIGNISVIGGKGSAVYLGAKITNGTIKIDTSVGHFEFAISADVQVNISLECVSSNLKETDVYLNFTDKYVDDVKISNSQITVIVKPATAGDDDTLTDDILAIIIKSSLSNITKIKLFSAKALDLPGISKIKQVRYGMKENVETVVLAALVQMTENPGLSLDFDETSIPANSNMALILKDDFFMTQILLPMLKNTFKDADLSYQNKQIQLNSKFAYTFDNKGEKTTADITGFTMKFEKGNLKAHMVAEKEPSAGIHIKITIDAAYQFTATEPKAGKQNIELKEVSFKVKKDASLEWWVYVVGGIAAVLAFPIFGIIATALGATLTGTLSVIIKNCFIPDISGTQITGIMGCIQWEGANLVKIDNFDLSNDVLIGGTFTF